MQIPHFESQSLTTMTLGFLHLGIWHLHRKTVRRLRTKRYDLDKKTQSYSFISLHWIYLHLLEQFPNPFRDASKGDEPDDSSNCCLCSFLNMTNNCDISLEIQIEYLQSSFFQRNSMWDGWVCARPIEQRRKL